ncbi:MAG: DNA polymerase IV [Gammaproteobacteria bacterium]
MSFYHWPRMIALMDMNAFFASIEQRDQPALRGRAIGITNGLTGTTIITCSYEARAHGIKTGMKVKEARHRCSHFIQVPAQPYRYAKTSTEIMKALEDVTPDLEIFSVDEAFLDMTGCLKFYGHQPEKIGRLIKKTVYDASNGLLCSVGISGDKTTAKWAAKQEKPNGLTIIKPNASAHVLSNVPVTELCGINKGIGGFLASHGVYTCGDMENLPISILASRYGNPGRRIWLMAQGLDPDKLQTKIPLPKTIGHGKVVPPNTKDRKILQVFLMHMSEKVAQRLRRNALEAQHYSVGLKTRSAWLGIKFKTLHATDDGALIYAPARFFLEQEWNNQGIYQIHIGALDPQPSSSQGDLFDNRDPRRMAINQTIDMISERFGEFTVCNAPLLHRSDMPNVISPSWKPQGHRNTLQP